MVYFYLTKRMNLLQPKQDKAEDLRYSNILIQKLICNELQTIRKELLSGFLKIHN